MRQQFGETKAQPKNIRNNCAKFPNKLLGRYDNYTYGYKNNENVRLPNGIFST